MREQKEFLLSLPANPYEDSVEVQVVQNGAVVATEPVPVTLSVPEFSVKVSRDPVSGRTYEAVIVDNRNKPARNLEYDFTVNKNKETYLLETDKSANVSENELFHSVDYLYQNLPSGAYDINSVFYENDQKVGEATAYVVLAGARKSFNIQYFFYLLLLIIVGFSAYVFLMAQKKIKES
jgi:hypothetical protein